MMHTTGMLRRALLGIVGVVPIASKPVNVAPATLDRHGEWMRRRNLAWLFANQGGIDDDEINRRTEQMTAIEDRILTTVPLSQAEALAQLELVDRLWAEDTPLIDGERVYQVVHEALPYLLRGGLN